MAGTRRTLSAPSARAQWSAASTARRPPATTAAPDVAFRNSRRVISSAIPTSSLHGTGSCCRCYLRVPCRAFLLPSRRGNGGRVLLHRRTRPLEDCPPGDTVYSYRKEL